MRRIPRTVVYCLLALQVLALPVHAEPVVSLRWGSCSPPNPDPNRNYDGSTHQTITVTGTGFTRPIRALDIRFTAKSIGSGIGDAWRFDAQGCNAGGCTINQVPMNDPCSLFLGAHPQQITSVRYDAYEDPDGPTTGFEQFLVATAFDAFSPDPARTYTLARFDFDFAAQCGCIERPLCIILTNASYLSEDGAEIQFATSSFFLTWNDPYHRTSCPYWCELSPVPCPFEGDTLCVSSPPVPVHDRSWGSVKASYR